MNLHSKHFDRIRAARRKAAPEEADAPPCSWKGCDQRGTHRAPLGRGHEGKYRNLCFDHVRQYNKSYNYFAGMSDEAVSAYQRDSLTGHRPTWSTGLKRAPRQPHLAEWSGLYEDPFGLFSDGPRTNPAPRPEPKPRRRLLPAERRAMETLGLDEDASKDAVKARYKALVKRHHPDANRGDRSCEARLRSVITAYSVLRRAGFC